ncbi:MAG: hypothetical protein ACI85I_000605 [Arenicella sp.]|jgi:hypothetical protein
MLRSFLVLQIKTSVYPEPFFNYGYRVVADIATSRPHSTLGKGKLN